VRRGRTACKREPAFAGGKKKKKKHLLDKANSVGKASWTGVKKVCGGEEPYVWKHIDNLLLLVWR